MVYHSAFNTAPNTELVCNCSILPIKTQVRGPAPPHSGSGDDIVGEALYFFKANCLFNNFDVQGPADRTLIYLTLFINSALKEVASIKNKADGKKALLAYAQKTFSGPGDSAFPLGGFFPAPKSRQESDRWLAYFRQLREETAVRMAELIYTADGTPDKWWMCFSKRKFVGKTM